jgi:hypothetical protein
MLAESGMALEPRGSDISPPADLRDAIAVVKAQVSTSPVRQLPRVA